MTKKALAVRHVHFEDLGAFRPAFERAGWEIEYVEAGLDPLGAIEANGPDLLIVLGGPIGAGQEDRYPFLLDELRLIERRLAGDRPLLGICLGAQLIARVAGARVEPGRAKEIGFAPIALTTAGERSCLAPFAEEPLALHWHGDGFELPDGAERLASTALCDNQAFALGRHVIGFQFHPEADAGGLERWLIGHATDLDQEGIDPRTLRAEARRHGEALARKADRVASAWLKGLAER
mgnify:CR=1 FL=1